MAGTDTDLFRRVVAGDLKQTSIRGGISTLTAEGVGHVLRVASIIILARWLMPEDFGLVGMVTALTIFAERFKDLGLDVATVQRNNLTHKQVSTLFWMNFGVGALIMLAVTAAAPLIARFYGEPELFWIAAVLASTFLFGGATIQHQALLRRQMQFGNLAVISILSTVCGFAAALTLAWYGYGYWALVWKEVVRAVAMAIGAWVLCPWIPGLPRRDPEIGSMVRVGSSITGFNIVYFLSRSLDQILIGKYWGAVPLGFYRQGHQLLMLPLSLLHFPVDYVALPALSALRGEPERYRAYYREIVAIIAFVSMPLLGYLALFSEQVIGLALGDKWLPTAPMFSVMALGGMAWPVAGTAGTVMISQGRTNRYFWLGVANAIILATGFSIGVQWGAMGVAIAYAVCTYVTLLPTLWMAFRATPVSVRNSMEAAAKPFLATVGMVCLLVLVSALWEDMGRAATIGLSVPIASLGYIVAWLVVPGGKDGLVRYRSYGRSALRQATAFGKTGLARAEG